MLRSDPIYSTTTTCDAPIGSCTYDYTRGSQPIPDLALIPLLSRQSQACPKSLLLRLYRTVELLRREPTSNANVSNGLCRRQTARRTGS